MKDFITVTLFVCINILLLIVVLLITTPSFSHHMAEDVADEEVYEKIKAFVADTPHARLVFQTIPATDTTVMTITTDSQGFFQEMVDEGIFDYFSMLDGDVTVTNNYVSGNAVVTITQVEKI